MIEKPVSRPMVPPIAERISTILALLSFLILSNVGVSKKILTNCKSGSYGSPRFKIQQISTTFLLILPTIYTIFIRFFRLLADIANKSSITFIFLHEYIIFRSHVVSQVCHWPLKVQVKTLTWRQAPLVRKGNQNFSNTILIFQRGAGSCLNKMLLKKFDSSINNIYLDNLILFAKVL